MIVTQDQSYAMTMLITLHTQRTRTFIDKGCHYASVPGSYTCELNLDNTPYHRKSYKPRSDAQRDNRALHKSQYLIINTERQNKCIHKNAI